MIPSATIGTLFSARSEQERKGPAEHRIGYNRIHWKIAADVAYPGALMRYCIGKDVLQSEAELGGARRDLAAFGKALVELPIVDVDFRAERDKSRAGGLRSLPEQAPGIHDDLVAATNEVLGNCQQGQDVTGYRGSGNEKPCHDVLFLSLTHRLTRCSFRGGRHPSVGHSFREPQAGKIAFEKGGADRSDRRAHRSQLLLREVRCDFGVRMRRVLF